MAYKFQNVPIKFGGLNTRVDPKTSEITTPVLLENMRYDKVPELRKRNGESSHTVGMTAVTANRLIKAGQSIVALGDEATGATSSVITAAALVEGSGFAVSGRLSPTLGRASSFNTTMKVREIINARSIETVAYRNAAYCNGAIVFATNDGATSPASGKVRVINATTGANIGEVQWQSSTDVIVKPKIVVLGSVAYIVGQKGSGAATLCFQTVTVSGSSVTFGTRTDITGPALVASFATAFFDVFTDGTAIWIAYQSSTSKLGICKLTPPSTVTFAVSTVDCRMCVGWMADAHANASWYAVTGDTTDGIKGHTIDKATAVVSASAVLDASTVSGVRAIIGKTVNAAGGYVAFYSVDGASTWKDKILYVNQVGVGGIWRYSASLVSKGFDHGLNSYYALVAFDGTNQKTLFLAQLFNGSGGSSIESGDIAGRALYGRHMGRCEAVQVVSEMSAIGSGRYVSAVGVITEDLSGVENGTLGSSTFQIGGSIVDIQMNDTTVRQSSGFGPLALTPGSASRVLTEAECNECFFNLAPQPPTLVAAGGSKTASSTYQVCTAWRTVTKDGYLLRSAPSEPVSITLGANTGITVTQELIKLTQRSGSVSSEPIDLELYCTEAGGSIFYLEHIESVTVRTNTTTATMAVTLGKSDVNLRANELLYTTGGVFDNFPPEANVSLEPFQSRVFGLSSERDVLFFSKITEPGEFPAFHPDLSIRLPASAGTPVALKRMDDKLLIFKTRSIAVLVGDGPDNTGNGEFAPAQVIDESIGALFARTIVQTPGGVMFVSDKGFYRVNRGLAVEYVGAPVHEYRTLTFRDAVVLANRAEVHWFTTEGRTLVYNWETDSWTTFTNQAAIAAVEHDGDVMFLDSSDRAIYTDTGFDQRDASAIQQKLGTGWIALGGINGFERLRSVEFLGAHLASHTVSVAIAYDYDETTVETLTIVSGADPWRYQAKPARQKCSAIKFTISASTTGEGFRLSGINLLVAVKGGGGRMAAAKGLV